MVGEVVWWRVVGYMVVPSCRHSAATLGTADSLAANLTSSGFPPLLHLSYTSHLTLLPPHLVTAAARRVLGSHPASPASPSWASSCAPSLSADSRKPIQFV